MVSRMHASITPVEPDGWQVRLGPLTEGDHPAWSEFRHRCRDWLVPWEPRPAGAAPAPDDASSFGFRNEMGEWEGQPGSGALGCLEIGGAWKDHVRYGMTSEEWRARRGALPDLWLHRSA